jgi:hypothetical protein
LTCQSNRFIDNSNNNFAITRNGDTSIQAFAPFAPTAAYSTANVGGSGYFDGTGDYLALASNAAFGFGSGDFTMECWFYKTTNNLDVLIDTRVGATSATGMALYVQSNTLKAGNDGERLSGGTVVSNSWNHCAVVRSGNNLYLYLNGTRTASAAFSTAQAVSSSPYIGNSGGNEYTGGYLASVRILKGTAQYTGNTYTVPTAPLTNIANTSLLCNFTNAGIFDQTAKTILETVGDAKVSTAQYKYGTGSMYFDGAGDYLLINQSNLLLLGTAPFTIEFWFKTTSSTQYAQLIGNEVSTAGFTILINVANSTDGKIAVYNGASGQIHLSSSGYRDDTWYHLALSRNSSGSRLFINGTQIGNTSSGQSSTSFDAGSFRMAIGANLQHGSRDYSGYIDDLRITKGYARYTSNFAAPTAALKDR